MSEQRVSFKEATAVKALSSHTYEAHFREDWVVGSVPHGGYVGSCFMTVASTHFSSTLKSCNQPHTISLRLDYLRRTSTGPALFTVKDVKIGRQTSVIHITLSQGTGKDRREEVICTLTQGNISAEQGLSMPTDYALSPPTPSANLRDLLAGTDPNWRERGAMPFLKFRKVTQNLRWFFPRRGFISLGQRGTVDEWVKSNTIDPAEKFTNLSLAYLADAFPQVVELAEHDRQFMDLEKADEAARLRGDTAPVAPPQTSSSNSAAAGYWYPTVSLSLDIKKVLPPGGAEWLFQRLRAKSIKNGRFDLETVIMDETGDIVAISHHVCFVLSASRNLAARRKTQDGSETKL